MIKIKRIENLIFDKIQYKIYKVLLVDGRYGIWKCSDKNNILNVKEKFAYTISDYFGFNIVPECEICRYNNKIGSVSKFMYKTTGEYWLRVLKKPFPIVPMQYLAVFDYITNCGDRNLSNFMISKNKVYAIDNNCTFDVHVSASESLHYLFTKNLNPDLLNIIKEMKRKINIYYDLYKKNLGYIQGFNCYNHIQRRIIQLYKTFIDNKYDPTAW